MQVDVIKPIKTAMIAVDKWGELRAHATLSDCG